MSVLTIAFEVLVVIKKPYVLIQKRLLARDLIGYAKAPCSLVGPFRLWQHRPVSLHAHYLVHLIGSVAMGSLKAPAIFISGVWGKARQTN